MLALGMDGPRPESLFYRLRLLEELRAQFLRGQEEG